MSFFSRFKKTDDEPAAAPPPAPAPAAVPQPTAPAPQPASSTTAMMFPDDELSPPPAAPPPQPKEPELELAEGYSLTDLLHLLVDQDGSDLHLSVGCVPIFRIHGHMCFSNAEPLTEEHFQAIVPAILDETHMRDWKANGSVDVAYQIPGVARFRCNVFRQHRGSAGVFRVIPENIPALEDLGFPIHVRDRIARLRSGLVVVTGPTGSGKSTTLAALVSYLNQTRDNHIITIEDPIEFTHQSIRCLVDHREVGAHAVSFADAARAALRQDPDVLLLGEMRDLDTIYNAIKAAETGALVFGTLHTNSAAKTIDRIIDAFPSKQQAQIRSMLSQSLKAVIAQMLLPRVGGGRVAAYEILLTNRGIANLIRLGETTQLKNTLQTSSSEGMQPLDLALLHLLDSGKITGESAKTVCHSPEFFAKQGYYF